jgi:hypothetical protein
MHHLTRYVHLVSTFAAVVVLSGCFASAGKSSGDSGQAAKPAAPKSTAGMNERGEVVDPKLVTAGSGQTVKGLNDWEGEITGKPVAGSKFARLQIGMTLAQARDLAGQPTDQGAHVTGKAFIPFFYGSDRYRYEMVYKGHGRLIFAGSAGYDSNAHLIWIIHSANETGYR